MHSSILTLEAGEYLAPKYKTHKANGLTVGITDYKTPTKTGDWHQHTKPMLSYVLNGGNLENRKQKSIERSMGSINFYHAYEPHQNIYKHFPSKHISVEIKDEFLTNHQINSSILQHSFQLDKQAPFHFIKILKEVIRNDTNSSTTIEMLFLELINKDESKTIKSSHVPQWVNKVKEILHDQWNESITLQKLADHSGVHAITISKNFRRYFSCTLGEYLRVLKTEKALKLLNDNKLSLTEIAFACGFSDQSHFIRIFKSKTGFIPKAFQKI